MMTITAVDCTGLNPSQITSLKNNGVNTVGRYLSNSTWKGLNAGEVANIKAAGLQIFSIYESNPTSASYFSAAKGKSDALDAYNLAKTVGQPEGTAIYFTVDYDAKAGDFPAILAYFQGIKSVLTSYKIGAYGSYTVLNYLHDNNAADYWFQTIAWSSGQHCSFLNIYQFQCDKTLGGVSVDYDNIEKADIGAWGQVQPQIPKVLYISAGGFAGQALLTIHDFLWNRKYGFDVKRNSDWSLSFLIGPFDSVKDYSAYKDCYDNVIKMDKYMHLFTPDQAAVWRQS
jgi:hypothetical protein